MGKRPQYGLSFELVLFNDKVNSLCCRRLPLAIYILWVASKQTRLGRRYLKLRKRKFSVEKIGLELPLGLSEVHQKRRTVEKAFCVDVNLGQLPLADAVRDLQTFFQCKVGVIQVQYVKRADFSSVTFKAYFIVYSFII